MTPITRREFVEIALTACACTLCPAALLGDETSGTAEGPGRGAPPVPNYPTDPVDVGTAADFAKDGIYLNFADTAGFFMVRKGEHIFAISRICSHKRGKIIQNPDDPNGLRCTKHKGFYDGDGAPISGPPKTPLLRFAITRNDKGRLIVDPKKQLGGEDWEKPEAFIKA